MDAQQHKIEAARASSRAAALAEAAALARVYETHGANVGFLQRVLANRASAAYEEADVWRHHLDCLHSVKV